MPSFTVRDIIEQIRFYTADQDDLTGKSVDRLFSNKEIVGQLKYALDRYSSFTKALDAIYSIPLTGDISVIDPPSNILRSEGIRFLVWFINGYAYPLNEFDLNGTYANFPVTVNGLPKWFQYWDDTITFYPQNSNGFNTTTLTADISPIDTTIPVVSTSNFAPQNGRFTLGNEKIAYKKKDSTNFYNCTRAIEDTTASSHSTDDTIEENNVWIYYTRLHFPITVFPDDTIKESDLDKTMLVYDEHIEPIVKNATFNLLSKIDQDRANLYKIDYEKWLIQAKRDIKKMRSRITNTGAIRDPYEFENVNATWSR